jgi:hypothetical protein
VCQGGASSGGLLGRGGVELATDRGGELGQVPVDLGAPEALLGFGQAGGGPPQAHVAVAPARNVRQRPGFTRRCADSVADRPGGWCRSVAAARVGDLTAVPPRVPGGARHRAAGRTRGARHGDRDWPPISTELGPSVLGPERRGNHLAVCRSASRRASNRHEPRRTQDGLQATREKATAQGRDGSGSASCSSVGLVVGQVVADGGHEHDVLCGVWWRVAQRLRHGLPAHAKGGTLHELR